MWAALGRILAFQGKGEYESLPVGLTWSTEAARGLTFVRTQNVDEGGDDARD
jgi:hypothetical protein